MNVTEQYLRELKVLDDMKRLMACMLALGQESVRMSPVEDQAYEALQYYLILERAKFDQEVLDVIQILENLTPHLPYRPPTRDEFHELFAWVIEESGPEPAFLSD